MNFIYYLLESGIYLFLLYGVYLILFSRLTFHKLNRYYLLSTTVLSFVLPLFKITRLSQPEKQVTGWVGSIQTTQSKIIHSPSGSELLRIGLYIYAIVSIVLLAALIVKIYRIRLLIGKGLKTKYRGITIVDVQAGDQSFSFFRFLFLGSEMAADQRILQHEMIHIRQGHSFDIIFLELLRIVNWFNPLIPIIQFRMKLIHEFIVDQEIVGHEDQRESYARFLIDHATSFSPSSLCSPFFGKSNLRKRILMIHAQKTEVGRKRRYMIVFLILPLMVLTLSYVAPSRFSIFVESADPVSKNTALREIEPKGDQINTIENNFTASVSDSIPKPASKIQRGGMSRSRPKMDTIYINHSNGEKVSKADSIRRVEGKLVIIEINNVEIQETLQVDSLKTK